MFIDSLWLFNGSSRGSGKGSAVDVRIARQVQLAKCEVDDATCGKARGGQGRGVSKQRLATCLVRCTDCCVAANADAASQLGCRFSKRFSNLSFGQHNAKSVNQRTRFETDATAQATDATRIEFGYVFVFGFPAPLRKRYVRLFGPGPSDHIGRRRLKVKFTE